LGKPKTGILWCIKPSILQLQRFIQDITNFVIEQGVFVEKKEHERIIVMQEAVISIKNEEIVRKLKIDAV
jgi:hypothetical protein